MLQWIDPIDHFFTCSTYRIYSLQDFIFLFIHSKILFIKVYNTSTLNIMCSFSPSDDRLLCSGLDSEVTQLEVGDIYSFNFEHLQIHAAFLSCPLSNRSFSLWKYRRWIPNLTTEGKILKLFWQIFSTLVVQWVLNNTKILMVFMCIGRSTFHVESILSQLAPTNHISGWLKVKMERVGEL
jgi:hypothetical protein